MHEPRVTDGRTTGPVDGLQVPRFAGHSTFARLPRLEDVDDYQVAVVGVPFDGGVTYRRCRRRRIDRGGPDPLGPFLTGRPSRAKALERVVEQAVAYGDVWVTSLARIADHVPGPQLPPRTVTAPTVDPG